MRRQNLEPVIVGVISHYKRAEILQNTEQRLLGSELKTMERPYVSLPEIQALACGPDEISMDIIFVIDREALSASLTKH